MVNPNAVVPLIMAAAQLRLICLLFGNSLQMSIEAGNGIVMGTPHWMLYQSRVLGPWTVHLLSKCTRSAYHLFAFICLAISGYLILILSHSWAAFFLFHLLFAFLLKAPWLYTWDFYGLIFFVLFVSFALTGKSWIWFAALFLVAIFNHENALYIALYMILAGMLMPGAVCAVTGMAIVHLLRKALLKREIGPSAFNRHDLTGKSIHIHIKDNIAWLGRSWKSLDAMIPLFLLSVMLIIVRTAFQYPALSAAHLALLGSIVFATLLHEPRAFIPLIPFATILLWQ